MELQPNVLYLLSCFLIFCFVFSYFYLNMIMLTQSNDQPSYELVGLYGWTSVTDLKFTNEMLHVY